MKEVKGNRGHWTEIYVILTICHEKKIPLMNIEGKYHRKFLPVLKIHRAEIGYSILDSSDLEVTENGLTEKVSIPELDKAFLVRLSEKIKKGPESGEKIHFKIPWLETILKKLKINKIESTKSGPDLFIETEENIFFKDNLLPVSIKSFLGGSSPTLFNAAGDNTNFIYKIDNFEMDKKKVDKINDLKGTAARIKKLDNLGAKLVYQGPARSITTYNLNFIDSNMSLILSQLILYSYQTGTKQVSSIVSQLERDGKLPIGLTSYQIKYKLQHLMICCAMHFTLGTEWEGKIELSKGFIFALKSGELAYINFFGWEALGNFLYENTKFEDPDSRNKQGKIESNRGRATLPLALQIRFQRGKVFEKLG